MLSVNLAVALRQRTGKRVAVMDGDFFYGNVGTYLGVPPVRSIMDLIALIDELDVEIADRVLIRHASGIRVLLSPPRPDQAAEITPEHVQRLLEFLSTIYDYIVVDCQTVIDNRLMPALELATDIMLVCTPEMGCLKNMRILLDQFVDVGIDLKKMHVVLNRAATNVEIEVKDIEQAFKQKVAFSLVQRRAARGPQHQPRRPADHGAAQTPHLPADHAHGRLLPAAGAAAPRDPRRQGPGHLAGGPGEAVETRHCRSMDKAPDRCYNTSVKQLRTAAHSSGHEREVAPQDERGHACTRTHPRVKLAEPVLT